MDESTGRDEYIAAIDARIKADTRLKQLLSKGRMSAREAIEWHEALNADYAAEQALTKARKAYDETNTSFMKAAGKKGE